MSKINKDPNREIPAAIVTDLLALLQFLLILLHPKALIDLLHMENLANLLLSLMKVVCLRLKYLKNAKGDFQKYGNILSTWRLMEWKRLDVCIAINACLPRSRVVLHIFGIITMKGVRRSI